jgi:hypothetical protein
MRYITKVRIVRAGLPIVVVLCCAVLGYDATRSMFAQTPAPAGISLIANQTAYTSGQPVTLYLKNASSKGITVLNKCPDEPLAVYRQAQGTWVQIHASTSSTKCHGAPHAYAIPAGKAVPIDYSDWPSLFEQPGTYRIVAPIEGFDGGPTVSFSVAP